MLSGGVLSSHGQETLTSERDNPVESGKHELPLTK